MKITEQITISGAYCRDYNSKPEVIKDFTEGKDFRIETPGYREYCAISDFVPGVNVSIRYHMLRRQTLYRITGKEPGYKQ